MPPAFSLRKCLGSYFFQSVGASCAPTCYLPVLYQTRTLRIQYYDGSNQRQSAKKPPNRAARGKAKRTATGLVKEEVARLKASDVAPSQNENTVETHDSPVEENRKNVRLRDDSDGRDKVGVESEKQEGSQKGHYDDQQNRQHDVVGQETAWRQPITVPLEPVTSTLTPGEQNTFAKLFDMAASGKLDPKPKKPPSSSAKGQDATEQQDEEMKQLAASILQKHTRPEDQKIPELDISRYPEPLRPIVVGKSAGLWEKQQEQQRIEQVKNAMAGVGLAGSSAAASTLEPANPNTRFIDIIKRMNNAKTDFELWKTLRSHVFDDFEKLEKAGLLEKRQAESESRDEPPPNNSASKNPKTKKKKKMTKAEKKKLHKLPDADIFRANYPHLLVAAVQQLRRGFPTSSLALTVLAETKALGLISYILGASTALYNESLDVLWSTYSDLGAVDKLLHEMDNGGIDFDGQTLALLDKVHEDCINMAGLPEGNMLGIIWRMDKSVREVRELGEWRDTVRHRLEAEALRMVRERESEADLMSSTL